LVDETEVQLAKTGENVILKIKGVEEEEVLDGFVVSSIDAPIKRSKELECQLAVLPLLDHKPIITGNIVILSSLSCLRLIR
jgi:translation elongation factor EF-1alpha